MDDFLPELTEKLDKDKIIFQKKISDISSMKVGGIADYFIVPNSINEIMDSIKILKKHKINYFVMGKCSNTIVRDGGFRGAIISIGENFSGYFIDEDIITVKAGTSMKGFAIEITNAGFSGLEFAGGIPGSVGGGVCMNAGAYDGEISDVIYSVTFFDGKEIKKLYKDDLKFSYRHSIFSENRDYIILECEFKMKSGGDISKLREFNARRREKQPLEFPSCGSVFKRPEGYFAGKLIQDSGLCGYNINDAFVSEKHCGFIINKGSATAKDVIMLMEHVRDVVQKKFGVLLQNEWIVIGEEE